VRQHERRDALDVVGRCEVATLDRSRCLRRPEQRERRARARAQSQFARDSRPSDDLVNVRLQRRRNENRARVALRGEHIFCFGDARETRGRQIPRIEAGRSAREQRTFLALARIRRPGPHEEAIELRFGKRIRAFELDGILRCANDEERRQRFARTVDRHLTLFHCFQQRRLRFGRRAIDLVREQERREDRPATQREFGRLRIEDRRADDVGRHEVGRELNAPERYAQQHRKRAHEQRLGRARNAFEQNVTVAEQRDQKCVRGAFVADDHAIDARL